MIKFEKYQGTGNDFIIINGLETEIENPSELAQKICNRHFGAGSDGMIIVKKQDGLYYMDFYNADGTIAPMCGNGTRCFATYLYRHGLVEELVFNIATLAGIMKVEFSEDRKFVKINLGTPIIHKLNQEVKLENRIFLMSIITLGTYHGVIFVGDLNQIEIDKYAPLLENHPLFPNRINVNFCQVIDENNLLVRTFERGVGFTLSCGTGSAAVGVISSIINQTNPTVNITVQGGNLVVSQEKNQVYLSGPAEFILDGNYEWGELNG